MSEKDTTVVQNISNIQRINTVHSVCIRCPYTIRNFGQTARQRPFVLFLLSRGENRGNDFFPTLDTATVTTSFRTVTLLSCHSPSFLPRQSVRDSAGRCLRWEHSQLKRPCAAIKHADSIGLGLRIGPTPPLKSFTVPSATASRYTTARLLQSSIFVCGRTSSARLWRNAPAWLNCRNSAPIEWSNSA